MSNSIKQMFGRRGFVSEEPKFTKSKNLHLGCLVEYNQQINQPSSL